MNKYIALVILLFFSIGIQASEYSICKNQLKDSDYEAKATSKLKVGYAKYGSISDVFENLADIADVRICTDTTYGVLTRTTEFIAVGTEQNIILFADLVNAFVDSLED